MTQNYKVLIASFIFIIISACTKSPGDKLIGEWQGETRKGEAVVMVFKEGEGLKYIVDNVVVDGGFSINESNEFIELDLIVNQSDEITSTPTILRFLTDDKIQLRLSGDGVTRPTEFSSNNESSQIVLERQ